MSGCILLGGDDNRRKEHKSCVGLYVCIFIYGLHAIRVQYCKVPSPQLAPCSHIIRHFTNRSINKRNIFMYICKIKYRSRFAVKFEVHKRKRIDRSSTKNKKTSKNLNIPSPSPIAPLLQPRPKKRQGGQTRFIALA